MANEPSRRPVTTGPDAAKLRRQLGATSWVVLEEMMERSTGDGDHVVAQVPIRSLASSLGLAKDTVACAVRRLSDLGVIEAVQVRASVEFSLVGPLLVRPALAALRGLRAPVVSARRFARSSKFRQVPARRWERS